MRIFLMVLCFSCFAGDTLWTPSKTPTTYILNGLEKEYKVSVIFRYDDLNYRCYTLMVRWHYKRPDGKYQVVPVDGRPFMCDNVDPLGECR